MTNKNEIICIYYKKLKTINLIHDYDRDTSCWSENSKKIYSEVKNYMNDIKDIDLYINDKRKEFNTTYTSDEIGEIKVKFIFHQLLTNTSYMFYKCNSLISIDLSSFDTTNVTNMSNMFYECSSLKSIDLYSLNTNYVTDMKKMLSKCSSLKKKCIF